MAWSRLAVGIKLLLQALLALLLAAPAHGSTACPVAGEWPFLVLSTRHGEVEAELLEAAAPGAVAQLMRLVRGPIFRPDLSAPEMQEVGYYDGLTFDHTEPHVLVATAERPPAGSFTLATEIDAEALGLDRRIVTDAAEAMEVLQRELLPERIRQKKSGRVTPRLDRWLDRWYDTYEAGFLVGASRQEVNEALGHVYRPGLASLPVRRGAVALWPRSATESSPRLTFVLADLPERDGRWMVIGRVTAGLEVVETISARPLRADLGARAVVPADPVVITDAAVECRPADPPIP